MGIESRRLKAQGRLIAIVEYDVKGFDFPFEIAVRPPGVRVIALDEKRQRIWLTKEYRQELNGYDIRVPGGKVFDSLDSFLPSYLRGDSLNDKAILGAAVKEFGEEVGLGLNSARIAGISKAGATVSWDLYYIAGIALGSAPKQRLETGEQIEPFPVSLSDIEELVLGGAVSEERSALWLLRMAAQPKEFFR